MNVEPDPELEEEFTVRLLECEEALATGTPATELTEAASPEMRTRLLRGLECMQRLQQLRPKPSVEAEGSWPARIGRFEIRGPLGRGGFGIVYRAYDPVLCREVALKIPRADALMDAECQVRFQREARAAAGLDHPNLVPVHEAGQLGPICYIAFAYCPGSDLATWLKQRTAPVRCVEAARLVQTVARAIHYAHGRGILHRDLKPSNILLSPAIPSTTPSRDNLWTPEPDSALVPRVTDFGLAKFAAGDQGQTQSGDLLGTPTYMAPEQVAGRLALVGPATDVYALGVLLYEVVTGRPPFWAETTVETLLQVESMEAVRPSRLRPELPRDLETICLKCLQKEPRKRYASASDLSEDLDRFLTGRTIQARPTSRAEQALKWARRRPALAASLGALVLVTLLGAGGILDQGLKTQHALGVAVVRQEQAQEAQRAEARERERTEVALYHHDVVLAHHEWLAGNVGHAAQLLDASPPALRNWEWRYVRHLCDNSLFTCAGHSNQVSSVAYSPDGRYIASASGQWNTKDPPGEVKLWDAATGELLWTGTGHNGAVMSVAFSPDSRRLASATVTWRPNTGEVKIWETATGTLHRTLVGMPWGTFGVAYSSDGKRLATAGADFKVRVWDPEADQPLFTMAKHKSTVFSVAFSPDGRQLASSDWEGAAFIWDLTTRKTVQELRGPVDLRSVAFSPDGRRLVAASFDHSVKIWELASGQLLQTYWGHRAPALSAAFAPDGHRVASTDTAGVVHVWDADTGRNFRIIRGHTGSVPSAAFSPDGRRLATGGREKTVRVWDITREQDAQSLPQAAGAVNVVFSPKGSFLAATGYSHSGGRMEKRVRIWNANDRSGPRTWEGHQGWLRCVAFSADEKLLASGSDDQTVRIWDVASERTVSELKKGHSGPVTGVSFNHDATCLASSSLDKTVRLWNLAAIEEGEKGRNGRADTRQLVPLSPSPFLPFSPSFVLPHPHPVRDVAFSPDGKHLVAVGGSSKVAPGAPDPLGDKVARSGGGSATTGDGMARVWDAATGTKLFDLPGHTDIVERAAFSRDGRWLATAGFDMTIRVWDMTRTAAEGEMATPRYVLSGHTDRVVGLCFSHDGRRLASTGGDQTIRLWDVDSGNDALTLRGHPDTICGVAFSPDGRLLVSASTRDIKVWDASDGKAPPVNPTRALRDAHAWHEQETRACWFAHPPQWFGAKFHIDRRLELQPDDWRLLSGRAHAEMELGQWQPAADDAARSIAKGASEYSVWLLQAVAYLQLDDTDGYRRVCESMLTRFGAEAIPGKRPGSREKAFRMNDTAWTCVLAPAAVTDLDRVVCLAEGAVAFEPRNSSFRNTLGAALYRAGRFEESLEMLRQQEGVPEDWLFLAMVHQRLGNVKEARGWLNRATRRSEPAHSGPNAKGTSSDFSRCRLVQIDLLHREAAALLAAPAPATRD